MIEATFIRTVNQAFDEFLKKIVNLDSDETKKAKSSRNWLLSQIESFSDKDETFPKLYNQKRIFFGSFARKTKIRELDDIDIMIALSAEGSFYEEYYYDNIEIKVPDSAEHLKSLCFDGTNTLNSRKVINKFLKSLEQVDQYEKADIKRNQEAATLKLKSYTWNYDLVPCFFTHKDIFDKDYYIIPDGQGNWKKTDPRIDRNRVTDINQSHEGNVLNVIRITKYWNKRPTMPTMSSYLLETMILNYYENNSNTASKYVDLEIPKIFYYIGNNIFSLVNDPKGIQGNINNLSPEEKLKISIRAFKDYHKAIEATNLEQQGEYKLSIAKWADIFGPQFPCYW